MHDLRIGVDGGNVKADRALGAGEVIVETCRAEDKEGGGDALEIERTAQLTLEGVLDKGNGLLGVIAVQHGAIVSGGIYGVHALLVSL
jgi:hypothetical protein